MKHREIIVDNFAGGGGASTGIELAIGRAVDIAINHDPAAIKMHEVNHPKTKHYCESVWDVDPVEACNGKKVGLAWFSPDCKHFSKAKGGKPKDENIRGLAWVVVKWAIAVKPRVIMLENVEEFQTWGPLDEDGFPIEERKGETFKAFIDCLSTGLKDENHPAWGEIEESLGKYFSKLRLMNGLGYDIEYTELTACDYGAPTKRNRFFTVARCDGISIIWPKQTHGNPESPEVKQGILKPWKTAADIIDWSIPVKSIFERKKPLADNTLKRIAKGIQKFVLDNPKPFVIQVNYSGADHHYCNPINKPLSTVTSKNGFGVVTPTIMCIGQTGGGHRVSSVEKPLPTVVSKAEACLVTPTLIQMGYGEREGQEPRALNLNKPLGTVTAGGNKFGLAAAFITKFYKTCTGQELTEPLHTITTSPGHFGEVRAFLMSYYGNNDDLGQSLEEPLRTVTTKDRFGLVTIEGQDYQIVDIGMRMLEPHELFKGSGFPDDYIIDRDINGKRYSKANQVARCGNAVPPPFAEALTRANLPELCTIEIEDKNIQYLLC